MFFNILKKDIKRKKTMNIILFIFITLCAAFMASSISNLSTVLNAVDYFGEKSNVADYYVLSSNSEVDNWILSSQYVNDSQKDTGIVLSSNNIKLKEGIYDVTGTTLICRIPEKYSLILNGKNNEPITSLKSGELALSYYEANRNNLKLGDSIIICIGDKEKEFTLSYIMKDMLFGTQYMDTTRIIISNTDYELFLDSDETILIDYYSIVSSNTKALAKDLQKQSFTTYYHFDKNTLESTFTMEMMIAAILIVVSVCLIIIALVILRFTIVFTLQDDYREIGVMKAIGLKNNYVKRLYIVKYLALATVGSLIGVIISIPFGNLLIDNIKNNIAMETATGNLLINILCGIIVILIVIAFCYLCTGKVNKFTAIQAIRSGTTGERFKRRSFLYLNRLKRTPTTFYLAINSILSALKSYSILLITFIIGTLLIILPLNAANTLSSDDIIEFFSTIKTDVYINNLRTLDYMANGNIDYMLDDVEALQKLYKENGVDITFNVEVIYPTKVYVNDPEEINLIIAFQSLIFDMSLIKSFSDGVPPKLNNEIAMTELSMRELGVSIGDYVNIIIGDIKASYLITSSFQSMNNMGRGIIFSTQAKYNLNHGNGIIIQGNFTDRNDIDKQIEKIKEITPEYSIKNTSEYINMYLGGISDTIYNMKTLILGIVLFINCLITVLLMKTFITREIGEIALIKNIGFTNKSIKRWQIMRIVLTLFISVIIGILLSNPMNAVMAKYTFGAMGSLNMPILVNAFEVYFLYPFILFIGTSIAAILSVSTINKINFMKINNVE